MVGQLVVRVVVVREFLVGGVVVGVVVVRIVLVRVVLVRRNLELKQTVDFHTPTMSLSTQPTAFKLTPQEAFIFGVSERGGQLRFGPSGSRVTMAVGAAFIGLLVGVLFAWAPDGMTLKEMQL